MCVSVSATRALCVHVRAWVPTEWARVRMYLCAWVGGIRASARAGRTRWPNRAVVRQTETRWYTQRAVGVCGLSWRKNCVRAPFLSPMTRAPDEPARNAPPRRRVVAIAAITNALKILPSIVHAKHPLIVFFFFIIITYFEEKIIIIHFFFCHSGSSFWFCMGYV